MSERKLRKVLELTDAEVNHNYDIFMEAAKHRGGAALKGLIPSVEKLRKKSNKVRKEILLTDPDVVMLLRHAKEKAEGDPNEGQNLWWMMIEDELANYMLDEFHVRLTDDGWKWVEEGE